MNNFQRVGCMMGGVGGWGEVAGTICSGLSGGEGKGDHCFKFPKTFWPYGVVSLFPTAIG